MSALMFKLCCHAYCGCAGLQTLGPQNNLLHGGGTMHALFSTHSHSFVGGGGAHDSIQHRTKNLLLCGFLDLIGRPSLCVAPNGLDQVQSLDHAGCVRI